MSDDFSYSETIGNYRFYVCQRHLNGLWWSWEIQCETEDRGWKIVNMSGRRIATPEEAIVQAREKMLDYFLNACRIEDETTDPNARQNYA